MPAGHPKADHPDWSKRTWSIQQSLTLHPLPVTGAAGWSLLICHFPHINPLAATGGVWAIGFYLTHDCAAASFSLILDSALWPISWLRFLVILLSVYSSNPWIQIAPRLHTLTDLSAPWPGLSLDTACHRGPGQHLDPSSGPRPSCPDPGMTQTDEFGPACVDSSQWELRIYEVM